MGVQVTSEKIACPLYYVQASKNEATNIEKLNRTRIHLILFSPLFTMLIQKDRGGRNPFRAMKLLGTDCLADLFCGSGGLVLCL